MFFHQWLLAGALALPVAGMAAEAVSLSPEQARTLGVRFQSIQSSDELNISAHARVVLRPDAQAIVAAPYAGALPRVLVAVGQSVRAGQPVVTFTSPQLYEARRAVAEAESQSRLAQQSLTRDRLLHEDGIIAASRWQSTQARATEAAAMAQARRAELAASGVKLAGNSPFLTRQSTCSVRSPPIPKLAALYLLNSALKTSTPTELHIAVIESPKKTT